MVAVAIASVDTWYPYGNDNLTNMNYQQGYQDSPLVYSDSITYNTALQPFIFDFDDDGDNEYVVFATNYIRVYSVNGNGFTFLNESNIARNSPYSQDVADIDGDGTLEFITISTKTTNSSEYHFMYFSFDGNVISVERDIILNLRLSSVQSGMRCSVDYNGDGTLDCLMAGVNKYSGKYELEGYDKNSLTSLLPSVNISLSGYFFHSTPEVIDANRDGYKEALVSGDTFTYPTASGYILVINQTAVRTVISITTDETTYNPARWYNRDGGDYEILYFRRFETHNSYGAIRLTLADFTGVTIWTTTSATDPAYISASGSPCIQNIAGGIGFKDINDGRIYVYLSCTSTFHPPFTAIHTYTKDGTVFSSEDVPSDVFYGGDTISFANMIEGNNLEFITPSGIIGMDGALKYALSYPALTDGWCVPVDIDGDLKLDLLCSGSAKNTSIFLSVGAGNAKPVLDYIGLEDYYPKIDSTDDVTLFITDDDSVHFYYLVDCDYYSGDDTGETMITYNKPYAFRTDGNDKTYQIGNCGWTTAGAHTIKAWVNDAEHGGDTALLTDMSSLSRTVVVGSLGNTTCKIPHFFFCEQFDYSWDIVYNNWVVSNYDNVFDASISPINNYLRSDARPLSMFHTFDRHQYPVMALRFNASVNYTTTDSQYHVIIYGANGDEQIALTFVSGYLTVATMAGVCPWAGDLYYCNVTKTTNNTWQNYQINIFYQAVKGIGGSLLKPANTFDVIQDGVLVARGMPFWAGYDGRTASNVTQDGQPLYSFYSNYLQLGVHNTEIMPDVKIDDIFMFKGTNPEHDNTAELSGILEVSQVEEEEVLEYWGCYIVNGANKGKFDCTYSKYNCKACCGTVHGKIVPVKVGCTFFKIGRMWAERFKLWFYRNIWYVSVVGGLILVVVLVVRKVKHGI